MANARPSTAEDGWRLEELDRRQSIPTRIPRFVAIISSIVASVNLIFGSAVIFIWTCRAREDSSRNVDSDLISIRRIFNFIKRSWFQGLLSFRVELGGMKYLAAAPKGRLSHQAIQPLAAMNFFFFIATRRSPTYR